MRRVHGAPERKSRIDRAGRTQLYFDRRRALLAWEAFGDKSDSEAVLLQLRAEELAAGLDGSNRF